MGVVGVGIDLVDVGRMARALARGGDRFAARVFTAREARWAAGKPDGARRFALCFAAKEALWKAMGTGWPRGGKFTDAELLHKSGAPFLEVSGAARDILDGRGVSRVEVTTSGERNLAICLVLLLR
ncbi:MAG: holo-ACP synthase [Myxococcota bacterium]